MSVSALAVNRTPDLIAAEINSIKSQTRIMILSNSIEIGRRLVEAKGLVPHGEWGSWLETSVDYSQRTAQNLMKVFEEYGSAQIGMFGDNVKTQAFADLTYSQAVALLGVPEEDREGFIEANDVPNMSTRELQQAIKERDEALKLKRELEEDIGQVSAERDKAREAVTSLDSKYTNTLNQLKESKDAEKELQKALEQERKRIQETGESEEKVKQLEQQLKQAQVKVEALQEEAAKPIEIEAAVIEKVPEAVEKELEELRKKANHSDDQIKFNICFDKLVEGFRDLLSALAEIKKTSPEAHEKYRNAVSSLIGQMSDRI